MASAASSTYRYSRLAVPVPQTSTLSSPRSTASTHFFTTAGITCDTAGWNLSPGPYRLVGMRYAERWPYCVALTWAWTRCAFLASPYGAFVSSG